VDVAWARASAGREGKERERAMAAVVAGAKEGGGRVKRNCFIGRRY
jgi:hypothetical protein